MGACEPTDSDCAFTCSMAGLENQHFLDFMQVGLQPKGKGVDLPYSTGLIFSGSKSHLFMLQCNADIGCLPNYPPDGVCLATADQALQVISKIFCSFENLFAEWNLYSGYYGHESSQRRMVGTERRKLRTRRRMDRGLRLVSVPTRQDYISRKWG